VYDEPILLEAARELKPQLVAWRRQFHQCPELSFEEKETAARVAGILKEMGLEVKTGIGGTGVVGILARHKGGPAVALRADMDALPVLEDTGVEYVSRRPGLMHACGHDVHMAAVLGAAAILKLHQELLPGSVVLIFQPGEEMPPGGARLMLAAGVLEEPPVRAVFGLHVTSFLPVGTIGVRQGAVMASVDNFTIKIRGCSCHGAAPHQGTDAIVTAAQVIIALQTVVARRLNPVQPAVLTVGTINGGQKENIIAGEVTMTGTTRALDPATRKQLETGMRQVLAGVATASGTSIDLEYLPGYPPTINDGKLLNLFCRAAAKVLGTEKIIELQEPSMGGEDFARYGEKVPAVYFNLGAAMPQEEPHPWHHPRFNINEDCLPVGAAVLAAATLKVMTEL